MKSSKPYAFVLWVSDDRLPIYLVNRLSTMKHFGYLHYIKHKAEEPREQLIKRSTKEKPKPHYHCVVSFRKAIDYDSLIRPLVVLWSSTNTEFGECPYTFMRTHEGKVNNISSWLAYVIHDKDYMMYLERKHDKPETYKHEYSFNDIVSTDYDILEDQAHNTTSFISQCSEVLQRFEDAKEIGANSLSLSEAISHCTTYSQMMVAEKVYKARRFDS